MQRWALTLHCGSGGRSAGTGPRRWSRSAGRRQQSWLAARPASGRSWVGGRRHRSPWPTPPWRRSTGSKDRTWSDSAGRWEVHCPCPRCQEVSALLQFNRSHSEPIGSLPSPNPLLHLLWGNRSHHCLVSSLLPSSSANPTSFLLVPVSVLVLTYCFGNVFWKLCLLLAHPPRSLPPAHTSILPSISKTQIWSHHSSTWNPSIALHSLKLRSSFWITKLSRPSMSVSFHFSKPQRRFLPHSPLAVPHGCFPALPCLSALHLQSSQISPMGLNLIPLTNSGVLSEKLSCISPRASGY